VHVPDGYLSPQTCLVGAAVAVPAMAVAARRMSRVVKTRNLPTLATLAAMSFLVMMFNVPVPDGTTAHAVGGVLIAICLGPWAAVVALSAALLLQALLFGDGGVLAYGVNVVNLAVVLPFVGYGVYRLVAGGSALASRHRVVAAAVGGYVGLNAAALAYGVELGIQPDLFTTAGGAPLYSPYHLSQTIPAMLLAHLTVAGAAEAVLTAGVVAYLQRADLALLRLNHLGVALDGCATLPRPRRITAARAAFAFVATMVMLTPLGLLAPGEAFGETAPSDLDLGSLGLSSIPAGLERYNGFWSHTLLGDYGFAGGGHPRLAYLVSAVVGTVVVGLAILLMGKAAELAYRRGRIRSAA